MRWIDLYLTDKEERVRDWKHRGSFGDSRTAIMENEACLFADEKKMLRQFRQLLSGRVRKRKVNKDHEKKEKVNMFDPTGYKLSGYVVRRPSTLGEVILLVG